MPADLASLRAEIDRIDDRIADLLVERLGVVREIGRVKGDLAAGRLALRLAREAQMMRRLLARTAGRFPAVGVLRIWREIIANSTQIEVPFGCVVDARGGVLLHDLARDQVGSATPIETVEDARAALARLGADGPLLAVLAPPDRDDWWPDALVEPLRVVARLPLTESDGPPMGFVAARLEPEPSGDDRTLLVGEGAARPPAARALAQGPGRRELIELDGFAAAAVPAGWRRLGAYAAPLALPGEPDAGEVP
jgi:chorismate mutase/prephenate dehydratase